MSARARAVGDEARKRLLRVANRGRFEQDFLREVPARFASAVRFAFYADWTSEERRLGRDIESFRRRIASVAGGETMASLPSPRAGDFKLDEHGRSHGAALTRSPVANHARTGVHPEGGMLLQRIVSGVGAKRILELGTNTGFSGCYFVRAASKPFLVTVEGSKELCEVANKNISRYSQSFTIMNQLFDEAIDELGAKAERFDCAFIDGQHERLATVHYADRVQSLMQPGGILVFDDVYWSDGMNQAWKELCMSPRYGLTIDLGWKGIAVLGNDQGNDQPKRHLDLCDYIGRPRIAGRDAVRPPA